MTQGRNQSPILVSLVCSQWAILMVQGVLLGETELGSKALLCEA